MTNNLFGTKTVLKHALLASAGIASLALSSAAFAQDAEAVAEEEDYGDAIIVTASKRSTTLQELPISVSVTSAETIEQAQIRDLIDLQTVAPSLRVSQLQASAQTTFIIRGFGNGANNLGVEPSVGVFIDGVYRSRSAAAIGDLPNVQRIEVLRGPQSTLFGKNASAGVISIVTQAPQFDFGGSVEATYGNFNSVIVKGNVTGPISETLAFSLGANYNNRDGFAQDGALNTDVNDRNRYGVRGQLLWEPNDTLSIRAIADWDKIDENCCIAANVVNGPTGAAVTAVGGQVDFANPFSFRTFNNVASTSDIENYGASVQGDLELDALTFTSISAYREVQSDTNQDSDFTSADLIGSNRAISSVKTFTQELRLASDFDGPLNFLLGGYYFDEKIAVNESLVLGANNRAYLDILSGGGLAATEAALGLPVGTTFGQQGQGRFGILGFSNQAISIFGTVDFEVTDRLTLTAGFNYTDDKKSSSINYNVTEPLSQIDLVAVGFAGALGGVGVNAQDPAAVAAFAAANPAAFAGIQAAVQNVATNPLLALRPLQFFPQFVNLPNSVESGRTHDTDLSYSFRASFEVSDQVNVYASYATGFKASSINLSFDSRPFAADFIAGSPVTNPAASRIRTAGLATPNLVSGTRFASPETAEVYEIGLKAQFDRVGFNLTLFDQTLSGFQSNAFTGTGFALTNAGKTSVQGFEFDTTIRPTEPLLFTFALTYLDPLFDSFPGSSVGNLTGQRPAGIAQFSISTSATYKHEFNNGHTLTGRVDFSHESNTDINNGLPTFNTALGNTTIFRREVNLVNAALSYKLNNGLEISAFARNLFNDQFLTTVFDSVAQAGSVSGYPNQPRTYGGSVRFKF